METRVLGVKQGKCSLTGREGECFVLRTDDGPEKLIATKRVLEILRWNAAILTNGSAASVDPAKAKLGNL